MKKSKVLIVLILALAVVSISIPIAAVAAQTPTNTPDPSAEEPTLTPTLSPEALEFAPEDPIRVGYMLWTSHPLGVEMLNSMEIALADFGGELLGHPLELTGFDSECNELAAQRAAQILVRDDSVVGIVGPICSRGALRTAPIVTDGGRLMVSPSSSTPDLTDPESRADGFFRTSPSDLSQVVSVAQFAYNELGARKLATVSAGSEKVQRLQSEFLCEVFTELGGECVVERTMETGSTYMPPIINTLVENSPDMLYFMGWGVDEAAAFLKAVGETPELADASIFFWQSYNTPEFLNAAGELAVGVYVSETSFEYDQSTKMFSDFYEAYIEEYTEEPTTPYYAFAYDATILLLKAIELVAVQHEDGSLTIDPLAVRDAMYSLEEYRGLTGWIKCSPIGDCAARAEGIVYEFTSSDPDTFNPGPAISLSSNPSQVWP
jgi:branched-chain amino acid transport system substrate-binding protein